MTTMTIKSKKEMTTLDRIFMLENEIDAMQNLIDRRTYWMNRPENKMKGTYKSVARDTRQMEEKIEDLKLELEDLKKKIA